MVVAEASEGCGELAKAMLSVVIPVGIALFFLLLWLVPKLSAWTATDEEDGEKRG